MYRIIQIKPTSFALTLIHLFNFKHFLLDKDYVLVYANVLDLMIQTFIDRIVAIIATSVVVLSYARSNLCETQCRPKRQR